MRIDNVKTLRHSTLDTKHFCDCDTRHKIFCSKLSAAHWWSLLQRHRVRSCHVVTLTTWHANVWSVSTCLQSLHTECAHFVDMSHTSWNIVWQCLQTHIMCCAMSMSEVWGFGIWVPPTLGVLVSQTWHSMPFLVCHTRILIKKQGCILNIILIARWLWDPQKSSKTPPLFVT